MTMASRISSMPWPVLALAWIAESRIDADNFLNFFGHLVRVGVGHITFVEHRNDFQIVVQGQVGICQGLRLYSLGGVDYQQNPFAGCQAPGNFITEIHMAGGIDQIEKILLSISGTIPETYCRGFYGNSPFPLQVHTVQELIPLFPGGDGAGMFQQSVCQSGLAVIDMGNYRKISDIFWIHTIDGKWFQSNLRSLVG